MAERVQSSTEEIHQMIEKLQQGAKRAVDSMSCSRGSAEESVTEAEQAREALTCIENSAISIHDLSTQIAAAAEQQSAVSEEMSRNIVTIKDQSVDNASASQQATVGCGDLVKTAQRLEELTYDYDL
ncbi:MAG: methyl-accepting chemotaxis protein [Motiliproteus sp.]